MDTKQNTQDIFCRDITLFVPDDSTQITVYQQDLTNGLPRYEFIVSIELIDELMDYTYDNNAWDITIKSTAPTSITVKYFLCSTYTNQVYSGNLCLTRSSVTYFAAIHKEYCMLSEDDIISRSHEEDDFLDQSELSNIIDLTTDTTSPKHISVIQPLPDSLLSIPAYQIKAELIKIVEMILTKPELITLQSDFIKRKPGSEILCQIFLFILDNFIHLSHGAKTLAIKELISVRALWDELFCKIYFRSYNQPSIHSDNFIWQPVLETIANNLWDDEYIQIKVNESTNFHPARLSFALAQTHHGRSLLEKSYQNFIARKVSWQQTAIRENLSELYENYLSTAFLLINNDVYLRITDINPCALNASVQQQLYRNVSIAFLAIKKNLIADDDIEYFTQHVTKETLNLVISDGIYTGQSLLTALLEHTIGLKVLTYNHCRLGMAIAAHHANTFLNLQGQQTTILSWLIMNPLGHAILQNNQDLSNQIDTTILNQQVTHKMFNGQLMALRLCASDLGAKMLLNDDFHLASQIQYDTLNKIDSMDNVHETSIPFNMIYRGYIDFLTYHDHLLGSMISDHCLNHIITSGPFKTLSLAALLSSNDARATILAHNNYALAAKISTLTLNYPFCHNHHKGLSTALLLTSHTTGLKILAHNECALSKQIDATTLNRRSIGILPELSVALNLASSEIGLTILAKDDYELGRKITDTTLDYVNAVGVSVRAKLEMTDAGQKLLNILDSSHAPSASKRLRY